MEKRADMQNRNRIPIVAIVLNSHNEINVKEEYGIVK